MDENGFENWLVMVDERDMRQTSDNISRAKRVENAISDYLKREVRLEDEYIKDKCASILEMISYEYSSSIPASINLPKDKNGLSSLRTAINKYIKFLGYKRQ